MCIDKLDEWIRLSESNNYFARMLRHRQIMLVAKEAIVTSNDFDKRIILLMTDKCVSDE